MGVNTDATAVPFQPPPAMPGLPASGINNRQDIRGMANKAKQNVSARQQQFLSMVRNNATPSQQAQQAPAQMPAPAPVMSPEQKFANAAAALEAKHDVVDRFVDWVLFG
jgi:hypothetical protein